MKEFTRPLCSGVSIDIHRKTPRRLSGEIHGRTCKCICGGNLTDIREKLLEKFSVVLLNKFTLRLLEEVPLELSVEILEVFLVDLPKDDPLKLLKGFSVEFREEFPVELRK